MKKTKSIFLSVCLLAMAAAGSRAGQQPPSGVIKDGPGSGTSALPAYKVLYSFTGGADGGNPNLASTVAALLRDSEGNLYGTAYEGGLINSNCPPAAAWCSSSTELERKPCSTPSAACPTALFQPPV